MVMHMKYGKPITNIRDRHVLIELDGDFTHDEMRHILNHAYLNHKAPHEYDEVKKYIRDLVIGKHNSVYIMNNGNPQPLASTSIFNPNLLSTITSGQTINYDFAATASCGFVIGISNNATCTSANVNYPSNCIVKQINGTGLSSYGYNNGNTIVWELLYTDTTFTSIQPSWDTPPQGVLLVGPYNPSFNGTSLTHAGVKYAYAAYQTSNNPLTLTTYYYWEALSGSFSYVYLNLYGSWNNPSAMYGNMFIPIFYSQGNYSFNANTYYISMWQFTYT